MCANMRTLLSVKMADAEDDEQFLYGGTFLHCVSAVFIDQDR